MTRVIGVMILALTLGLLAPLSAAGQRTGSATTAERTQASGAERARVQVSRAVARVAARVRVRGQRFPRRALVRVRLGARQVAALRTDRAGRFSALVRVPRVASRAYRLSFTSRRTRRSLRFRVARARSTGPAMVWQADEAAPAQA
ncbi:MAG: hypothetical protein M3P39_04975, partial [Actinomycetota bacterium]|nr:hypothetical protein [Actinomycetota bacterium]